MATEQPMREDIAVAWERVNNKIGKKRDIKKLPEYLSSDERVLSMAGGVNAGNNGLLVATTKRVIFVSEGVINHSMEDFPYDRITTVTTKRGMMFGKILVTTAGNTRVIEQVDKREAEAVSSVVREQVEAATRRPPAASTAPPARTSARGLADELKGLAELRDAGVLTEQEFAEQKARLLSR